MPLLIFGSSIAIFGLGLCVFLQHFLLVVTVENQSMSPTLEHGERVLALRHWPAKSLHKGLIVLVRYRSKNAVEPSFPITILYIKRIAGLGGETLIVDKEDSFAASNLYSLETANQSSQQVWTIPKGHIFVLGDNRAESADSRIWGPLPEKNVVGVVIMKLPNRAHGDLKISKEVTSVAVLQSEMPRLHSLLKERK